MTHRTVAEQLDFVRIQREQDEAKVLAEAVRAGIEVLYREALVESYLMGKVPRETVLAELGPEHLGEIEFQREALRRDVAWGLKGCLRPSPTPARFCTSTKSVV